jgi:squalene-hopene/tetraprenyl-beta-curcumene cyclase
MKPASFAILTAVTIFCTSLSVRAIDPSKVPDDLKYQSVRQEVETAVSRALAWMDTQQQADGHWSNADFPAITGLVLTAYMRAPGGKFRDHPTQIVKRGFEFITGSVREDGGIYKEGLSNYNTAICLSALLLAGNAEHKPIISRAAEFVAGMQAKDLAAESLDGGFGYGPAGTNRQHPDLSNTVMALEALYLNKKLAADVEISLQPKLDWEAAIGFIQRCQNLPSHNKESWASDDPENKGGFVYFPGKSMADEKTLESGKTALRSYGSMTYAGVLSYIYANLEKNDPRIQAALEWLSRNYTLEENPGMGKQGLFYYYHLMAKALAVGDIDELTLADGRKADWRTDLALKLISIQRPDGSWLNAEGRWMENDPVLVTAYAVIALDMLHAAM